MENKELSIGAKILEATRSRYKKSEHPRLVLTAADFERFKKNREIGDYKIMIDNVIKSADKHLEAPLCEYKIPDGVRLLTMSHKVEDCVKHLAMAYRITGEKKYADRAIAEIKAACDSAQATKFIENFKGQFDYDLGQGGKNVSGGQKQRLCIARTLLKNPKIIILDDSTSAVDTATEAQIRKAFSGELKDSTKIIIAQRISSVKEADVIVIMNDGRITGVGTHDELLDSNTEYQEIYYSQNEKKEGK